MINLLFVRISFVNVISKYRYMIKIDDDNIEL